MSKLHSPDNAPLTARNAALRLRLLYSWEESLAAAGGASAKDARRARREIQRLRQTVQAEVERLGKELQRVFAADQTRPGNVVIEEKLGQIRHAIRQFNQVLKAVRADDLGGVVELPLEHYPVELGLGRDAPVRLERDDFITLAAAAAIILVSSLTITWYHLWREDVTFNVDRPATNQIAIIFKNDSSFVASLYGPWPDSDAGLEKHSYGVRLLCRTSETKTFQDCTNIRDAWGYQGQVISPLKPVQVDTGVSATILLHIPTLEKLYGSTIEAVEIECGSRRNRDAYTFELALHE